MTIVSKNTDAHVAAAYAAAARRADSRRVAASPRIQANAERLNELKSRVKDRLYYLSREIEAKHQHKQDEINTKLHRRTDPVERAYAQTIAAAEQNCERACVQAEQDHRSEENALRRSIQDAAGLNDPKRYVYDDMLASFIPRGKARLEAKKSAAQEKSHEIRTKAQSVLDRALEKLNAADQKRRDSLDSKKSSEYARRSKPLIDAVIRQEQAAHAFCEQTEAERSASRERRLTIWADYTSRKLSGLEAIAQLKLL